MNKLPVKLQELIDLLQSKTELDNLVVNEIVESVGVTKEDIEPIVNWNHCSTKSYGKKLLFGNDSFNIYLMSWRKGDFTAIHNHGLCDWGCVCCFGNTTHRLYEEKDKRLNLVGKSIFTNGQHVLVNGGLTHLMGNSSDEDIFTIHIYGNNTGENNVSDKTKVYIPEQSRTVATSGSAYLNLAEDFIICGEEFTGFSNEVIFDYLNLVKPYFKRNNLLSLLNPIESKLIG